MRTRILISGFIACLLGSSSLVSADVLPTPQDLQQSVNDGVSQVQKSAGDAADSVKNALPPLPALTDAPALPNDGDKSKPAALSVAPPVHAETKTVAPAAAATTDVKPTDAKADKVAKAPATATPPAVAPVVTAVPPAAALSIPAPAPATTAKLGAVAAPVPAATAAAPATTTPPVTVTPATTAPAASASTLPLPASDSKNSDLMVPPLPNDPSMLPSPGNSAANPPPAIPFAVPDGSPAPAQATIEQPAVTADTQKYAIVPATTDTKKKKHGKRSTKLAAAKVHYRNVRLPSTIYNKHYAKRNKDLPLATYETDLDRLVFVAVKRDDLNGVRAMLDYSKRNINKPNAMGETPLILAARSNAYNVVRLLIGKHADMNAKDNQGYTALMAAQQAGNARIAGILKSMEGGMQVARDASGHSRHLMKTSQDTDVN